MTRIVRKHLMTDALGDFARQRGISESQAAREAIAMALGTQEMAAALQGLHDAGAFADLEATLTSLADPGAIRGSAS